MNVRPEYNSPLIATSVSSHGQQIQMRQVQFWKEILIACVLLCAVFAVSANPLLTILSVAITPLLMFLLWRPGEPPVLLFALGVQWLQVATVVFYADYAGAPIGDSVGGPQLRSAVLLGLTGLVVLALGARIGMGASRPDLSRRAESEVSSVSPSSVFVLYVCAVVVIAVLQFLAQRVPQVAQLLIATVSIKWILLFILTYSVLQRQKGYGVMWIAAGFEFVSGFLSYFSTFKSVFFLLIVALLTSRRLWTRRRVIVAAIVGVILATSTVVWSAIKSDYRDFLNQGTNSQEVLVPIPERIAKLRELVRELSDEGFFSGFDLLVSRVGYVTYFADVLENVPDHVPYADGALWFGAIKHVLIPRLIDPDKAALDDSARTNEYTGVQVAGAEQGTSISIGYMAESYIDFGPVGMFAPIFFLGLLYGCLYRGFVHFSRFKVMGFAAATSVLIFSAALFETSNVKLVGGVLTWSIVAAAFLFVAGRTVAAKIGLNGPILLK